MCSFLVNGSPTKVSKGLRQGDPSTSYMFMVVVEGLIREAIELNMFSSFKVGNEGVQVNLLQYKDDTIFFGKTSLKNVMTI